MTIVEIKGGRITHHYLVKKRKDTIARMYMDLLREYEQAKKALRELRDECDAHQGPELREDEIWRPLLENADRVLAGDDNDSD